MAIKNKYYTASTVSRDLPTGERSFEQVVYQSGKPILDAELNHDQDIKSEIHRVISNQHLPSGFFKAQNRREGDLLDYEFITDPSDPNFVANAFWLNKITALVAGMPIIVEYANTDREGKNLVQLQAPSVYDGSPPTVKRTDFVFLEVWRSLVSSSAKASGLVQVTNNAGINAGDIVELNGENFIATVGIPVAFEFAIGANEIATAANLASAITNDSSFSYAFANGTDTVTIISKFAGTVGNAYTLSTTNAGSFILSGATLSGGVDEDNKPDQDHVYRHGNNDSSVAVALEDDLQDPIINVESTKRVQVQYRIRVTGASEAVNFKTQADGFSNANVFAQGGQSSPNTSYPFVKADGSSTSLSSDAGAYDTIDNGLFIAGDGSSTASSDLDSVDGFVYAIPICFVHRRNDAWDSGTGNGFDPQNNTNGGLIHTHAGFINTQVGSIGAGLSDRPDGYFADILEETDLLDLRRHISPNGVDLAAELQYQMKCLLDGNYRTWSIDTADKQTLGAGSGDVSTRHLVCNEIGRDTAHGGNPVLSGDTTRGDTIANFDHIRRRFGDQPVVERAVFTFRPIQPQSAFAGRYVEQVLPAEKNWVEGDRLHLDISSLNATTLGEWDPSTASYAGTGPTHNASVADFAPPLVTITDILVCIHDDGHYVTPIDKKVQIKQVEGLGTDHVIITLDRNPSLTNAGGTVATDYEIVQDIASAPSSSNGRRIFIEYEITYPAGHGISDTPDLLLEPDNAVYPVGAVLENDFAFGSSQQPLDTNGLLEPKFREGFREVMVEYQAQSTTAGKFSGVLARDEFVSDSTLELTGWRRFYENRAMVVTDLVDGFARPLDLTQSEFGASTRKLKIDGGGTHGTFSGQQTLVRVDYTAQDPVPNYGAAGGGYQIAIYYRSNAPQTCGTREGVLTELPVNLEVTPLIMSHELWSGTVGMGSVELPFPYLAPLDQIPVNDGGAGTFVGEWYFMATAQVSIDDFNADTGLLNLHAFVPADATQKYTFNTSRKDTEFRAYYAVSDVNSYRPTVFTQELSGINRHKCFVPFLAKATQDTPLFRKGEVLLMVLSRWAELDAENNIVFADTDNRTCVGVYRTKNLLILSGE